MNRTARATPSFCEPLESRLFFSVNPASIIAPQLTLPKVGAIAKPAVGAGGTGITGEYFSGNDYQTPLVVRNDNTINFNWGNGRPDQDIPKGPFSAQWSGQIEPLTTGNYTFYTTSDSGSTSVTVNGVVLFDQVNGIVPLTTGGGTKLASGTVALVAGQKYDLTVGYASRAAGASKMQLLWSGPGVKKQVVPKSALFGDPSVTLPTSPLSASYYLGPDFNTPIMTRVDSAIDFNWGSGTPDAVIPDHKPFSIRWLGQVTPSVSGLYTFKTTTDDGVRLWVNGTLIIDQFHRNSGRSYTGTITLQAGEAYAVRMDYYEVGTGVSLAKLQWAPPGQKVFTGFTSFTAPIPLPVAPVASATVDGYLGTISWTPVPTATSYLVEESLDGSTGWVSLGTVADTPYRYDGLPSGTFYFRVTAINATGSSPVSNVVNLTTPPNPPTGLTATAVSHSEIDLAWNDVPGENGFAVEESPDGSTGWFNIGSTPMGTTSFAANGLSADTTYFFRVDSLSNAAVGSAGPSIVATAMTGADNPTYSTLTTVYGLTGNGTVYSIDTTDGATAQIGTLSFGTNAAGRDPYTSNFYYISTGTSSVTIASWNPFDGTNTVIASAVPLSGAVAQAAFATDGTFFFTTDVGDIYAFNTDTDVATLKGNIQFNGSTLDTGNGDMAFAPDGTLYLETSSVLYTIPRGLINIGAGAGSPIPATEVGTTTAGNLQLAFGENGILFGTDANGQLYSVNTTTAATTPIGTASGVDMGDLASVPLESDLTVTQSASTFVRGTNGAYTLTVNNIGPNANVGAITLIDTLPAGVTYVSGSGNGWTFSVSGQVVTMTYTATVPISGSAPAVTLNVAVTSAVADTVTNAVTVSSSIFETNTSNDSSTLDTAVSG